MRKSTYSVFLAVLVLLLPGCVDMVNSGTGSLFISLGRGSARNIFDDASLASFTYILTLSGPGGQSETVELEDGQTSLTLNLGVGAWNIEVKAYDPAHTPPRLSGTGSTEAVVRSGRTNRALIDMNIAFDTYYVSASGNNTNDGLSTATAFATLSHAIDKAAFNRNDLSVITVLDDISAGGITINKPLSTQQRPLVIRGNSNAPPTISNAPSSDLFTIEGNSWVVFENIKIENTISG
jgi:hypothetical protein